MTQNYTDKEVLGDGLDAQKGATNLFNMMANECVHDDLRETILDILNEEHRMQVDVFNMIHERGFYPTPSAQPQKVEEVKHKFAQACGGDTVS